MERAASEAPAQAAECRLAPASAEAQRQPAPHRSPARRGDARVCARLHRRPVAHQASQALQYKGAPVVTANQGGLGTIYSGLIKQASMLSFNDAFYLLSVFMILILPLVFLMKKAKTETPAGAH